MKKDKTKVFWYLIAIGFIVLFLLILVSSIINIGEKFRNLNSSYGKYIEWGFYALCLVLIWFLILNPVRIIVFSPSLSIVTTLDKDSPKAHSIYKSVSKNILKQNAMTLTDEEKNALENYHGWDELRSALNLSLQGTIKKQIRQIIVSNARTVMLSTAISQNAKLDSYSVITVNLRMIKQIVEACGFRPTMKNLSKLTIRVGTTALIADGLENLKIEDVLPTNAITTISNIPFLKPVLESVSQGLMNALLTIRVGLVCKNYLFSDSHSMSKEEIRADAFKEALILLPLVLADVVTFFPKKIVNLFKKNKEEKEKEENKETINAELVTA